MNAGCIGSSVPVPTWQHLFATGSAKPLGELVPTKYMGTDSPGLSPSERRLVDRNRLSQTAKIKFE